MKIKPYMKALPFPDNRNETFETWADVGWYDESLDGKNQELGLFLGSRGHDTYVDKGILEWWVSGGIESKGRVFTDITFKPKHEEDITFLLKDLMGWWDVPEYEIIWRNRHDEDESDVFITLKPLPADEEKLWKSYWENKRGDKSCSHENLSIKTMEVLNGELLLTLDCDKCGKRTSTSASLNQGWEAEDLNTWAQQELSSHGQNVSFKNWAKKEVKSHGNIDLVDWAKHEKQSHTKKYGAEYENIGTMQSSPASGYNGYMNMMSSARRIVEIGNETGLDQKLGEAYQDESGRWFLPILQRKASESFSLDSKKADNINMEEPVIEEPSFIPDGDGRAIGQQNSSINLSPLHAEGEFTPYVIDGKRRVMTWKENAREIKKEYDDEDWRDADKQIDYLKGIHEYLEDCTDEEFEDWFRNIDRPDMSQFAFDYKNVFGNATDRDERMNYFEGYINMLREGQQNMFPEFNVYGAETFEAFSIDKDDEGKIHIENKCDDCGKEFRFTQNPNLIGGNRAGAIAYEMLNDGEISYPAHSPYGDLLCKACWKINKEEDETFDAETFNADFKPTRYKKKGWVITRNYEDYMEATKGNRHIQIHYNKGDYEPYMMYRTTGSGEYYFKTLNSALDWLNGDYPLYEGGKDFRNAETFEAFSIDEDDEGKIHIENKCDDCGKEFRFTQNPNLIGGNRAGAIAYEMLNDGEISYPAHSPYGDLLCKACWKINKEEDETFDAETFENNHTIEVSKDDMYADFKIRKWIRAMEEKGFSYIIRKDQTFAPLDDLAHLHTLWSSEFLVYEIDNIDDITNWVETDSSVHGEYDDEMKLYISTKNNEIYTSSYGETNRHASRSVIYFPAKGGRLAYEAESFEAESEAATYSPSSSPDMVNEIQTSPTNESPQLFNASNTFNVTTALGIGGLVVAALSLPMLYSSAKSRLGKSAEEKRKASGSVRRNHTQVKNSEYSVGQVNPVEAEGQQDIHGAEGITNPRHAPSASPAGYPSKTLKMW